LCAIAAGLGSLVGALLGGVIVDAFGFGVLFTTAAGLVAVATVVLALVVYPPGSA
jgi:predicted MFS family arabinose efflux permease